MPSKLIAFSHKGETAKAEVFYNFEDFSDVMIVVPITHTDELKGVIFLSKRNKHWEPASVNENKSLVTIHNIINCINNQFV
jgi:hypothetical protein